VLTVAIGLRSKLMCSSWNTDWLNKQMQSALGAAMMGGIASGTYSGLNDPQLPSIRVATDYIKPRAALHCDVYDQQFSIFASLYPALAGAMHQLAFRRSAARSDLVGELREHGVAHTPR